MIYAYIIFENKQTKNLDIKEKRCSLQGSTCVTQPLKREKKKRP